MGPIEFEVEGDNDLIEREREQFFKLLPQAITTVTPVVIDRAKFSEAAREIIDLNNPLDLPSLPKQKTPQSYESIAQFIKQKGFSSIRELVLGISLYIDQIENKTPFTVKDIEEKYSEARITKPSNINDAINKNITKGYLLESPEKRDGLKTFRISQSGIEWVQNYQVSENSIIKTAKNAKPRVNKKNVETQLLNISLDELNLEKYCDISSLESIRDQVFVVTYIYSIEKKVDYFTYEDIVSILKNKFNVSITHRQVKYVFENVGTLFDKKNEGRKVSYKIMASGIKEATRINSENIKSA
ncbi:MAG: hypothetical protein ACYDH2_04085 [Anaerolineaceae bacterium]